MSSTMMTAIRILLLCSGLLAEDQMKSNRLDPGTATLIAAGISLTGTTLDKLMSAPVGIIVGFEVSNWTKWPLTNPATRVKDGKIDRSPVHILPGTKEAMVACKEEWSAYGTVGTASWLIEGLNRRVFVMWYVPYDRIRDNNWLAVGLSKEGHTDHAHGATVFNQMFHGSSSNTLKFERKIATDSNSNTITVKDDDVKVTGYMGSSRKTQFIVHVQPLRDEDYAPRTKKALGITTTTTTTTTRAPPQTAPEAPTSSPVPPPVDKFPIPNEDCELDSESKLLVLLLK